MSSAAMTGSSRPARWGLSAKLLAILILLGAVAVTSVLGYVRARDALEQAIFNQLTAARVTKAHHWRSRSSRARRRSISSSSPPRPGFATKGGIGRRFHIDGGRAPSR